MNYVNNASRISRSQRCIVSCLLKQTMDLSEINIFAIFPLWNKIYLVLKSKSFSLLAISLPYHSFQQKQLMLWCYSSPLIGSPWSRICQLFTSRGIFFSLQSICQNCCFVVSSMLDSVELTKSFQLGDKFEQQKFQEETYESNNFLLTQASIPVVQVPCWEIGNSYTHFPLLPTSTAPFGSKLCPSSPESGVSSCHLRFQQLDKQVITLLCWGWS